MKPIFLSGPSFLLRLSIVIAFSLILFLADSQLNLFASARIYLNSLVSPIQYIADAPQKLSSAISENLLTRQALKDRNLELEKENLYLKADRLLLTQLENENKQLRELLNSQRSYTNKRMITEVMSLRSDPFSHQLLIDKGASDGVYVGQPVINEQGVVGQVSQVGTTTSRVLLIVDASHGIPVRVQRNDIAAILHGSGAWNKLNVPFVQSNADLKEGDLLVTSGLGGRFPAGYPVAKISHFNYQEGALYAEVTATPVALLDRSRYLLLLWNDHQYSDAEPALDLESEDVTAE
ncbi:rod shape-determining protein MreC [Psychromonas sp. psych-6C06]|uniref:rod shape-determining protein MreC n=1 Tax=Psychromonas sp. psych-6C06 TaxID=2058089 RepID=UPI000C329070|nr:rod shape-determining protein MreC [Psychromonas sp. psych-6C06]PKF62262.1 rod shape-determining protein MreC [Psychromonas sp. psych-6C06]